MTQSSSTLSFGLIIEHVTVMNSYFLHLLVIYSVLTYTHTVVVYSEYFGHWLVAAVKRGRERLSFIISTLTNKKTSLYIKLHDWITQHEQP